MNHCNVRYSQAYYPISLFGGQSQIPPQLNQQISPQIPPQLNRQMPLQLKTGCHHTTSLAHSVSSVVCLTLVTVCAPEALLALARELPPGLAPASPVGPADVRRDVAHTLGGAV